MTSGQKSTDSPVPQRLESWKQISAYLNCNERTAKRWEVTRGLPIRRLPGARGGVFALVDEIQAWRMGAPETIPEPLSVIETEPAQDLIAPDQQPFGEAGCDADTVPENTGSALAASSTPIRLDHPETMAEPASAPSDLTLPDPSTIPLTIHFHDQAPIPAKSGFHWQVMIGVALLLLLVLSLSRFHESALASRREMAAHVPSAAVRELDLKGRFYWNKRIPQDLKFALATFQKAVAMDPEYADAYAGMAECYGLSTEYASLSVDQAYPPMLAAAQKAITLDPNLATAHRALGFALFYWNWDRAGADREFQRAIALNPNDATTHHWYANVLLASQRYPEALQQIEKARELDPGAPSILADRGLAFSFAGRIVEAKEDWQQLEKTDPSYLPPHWYLAEHYLHVNDVANYMAELKAIAAISGSPDDVARSNLAQAAFARGKDKAVVNELADFSMRLYAQRRTPAMKAAFALAGAGRNQEALEYIHRAYKDRDQDFLILPDRNKFPALLDSPEYQALAAKSRLPYPQDGSEVAVSTPPALQD